MANLSQALLSTLDAILGSTESSRAIAAIITLIRREFRFIEPAGSTESIGVGDLLVGSLGFALLQRWGKKNTERYLRQNGGEVAVWDLVILDSGLRADVIGSHPLQFAGNGNDETAKPDGVSCLIQERVEEGPPTLERRLPVPSDDRPQVSDEDIRAYIMSQLPRGCHASIRSDVLTARTITVDIYDDNMAEIAAPPGTKMVEERFHHDYTYGEAITIDDQQQFPRQTVVFRTALKKSESTQLRPHDDPVTALPVPDYQKQVMLNKPLPVSPEIHDRPRSHFGTQRAVKHQASNSSTETKPDLDKGFTKFTQKVTPSDIDSNEPKRPLKKAANSTASRDSAPRLPPRPAKRSGSGKSATTREDFTRPDLKRPPEPPDYHAQPAVPNRGLRRSPSLNSSQRPSQSPTKHASSHNIPPRASRERHFTVKHSSQESLLTQAEPLLSRCGADAHSGSPAATWTHVRSRSSVSVTQSESDDALSVNDTRPSSSGINRRPHSYTPSLYSLATAGSEKSLLLAHRPRKSAYGDAETIQALQRDGLVPGVFPERHFVQNIRRFCRFSSASYGSNALKVMGVPRDPTSSPDAVSDGHVHSAFSENAGLPPSTILLSSFVDPAGGSNAAGETETGFPLVHYLSIDHDSKAIVLTLRGTWGFEDILTDMTCDYDNLEWQGKTWKVHKGMHASAKRLLEGGGARVMTTLRAALEEHHDYGLVLCGHSLGGGVAALLATMVSEPNPLQTGTSFVTSSHQPSLSLSSPTEKSHPYTLPANRPIHVYAYGPPAVMSPFLRLATRGLITTIVNGSDIVPCLSLGILHDMHSAALSFKDDTGAQSHIRRRLRDSLRQSIIHKFYINQPPLLVNAGDGVGEDAWAWKTLNLLRDEMRAPKLLPPGEVFVVDTMRVLQRDAFTSSDSDGRLGRPATRVLLKFIRDVEVYFGELRFAGGMLSDHNPARYETSLAALARGVLDE